MVFNIGATLLCPSRRPLWLLGQGYCRGVDVQLVQRAVGVVTGAVGVVRPGRMGDPAVERQPGVVAVVDPVSRIVGVGGSRADLDVAGEARPAVAAERPPELGVVV